MIDADAIGFEFIELATTDCGDPIFLRAGRREPNTVYTVAHHDPAAGIIEISPDVDQFIAGLKSDEIDLFPVG